MVLVAYVGRVAGWGLVAAAYDFVGLDCGTGVGKGVGCGDGGKGWGDFSLRRRFLAGLTRLSLSDGEAAVARYSLALDGSAW